MTGFEPTAFPFPNRDAITIKKPLHEIEEVPSGWQDSNLRPPAPKAGAITGLRYTPKKKKRRVRDSNPWYSFPYACLANMSFRPLRQLSKFNKQQLAVEVAQGQGEHLAALVEMYGVKQADRQAAIAALKANQVAIFSQQSTSAIQGEMNKTLQAYVS